MYSQELLPYSLSACSGQASSEITIREKAEAGLGKGLRAIIVNQNTVDTRLEDLWYASNRPGHDRHSEEKRFEQNNR